METQPEGATDTSGHSLYDADATCERCGRYGAYCFEGQALCASCYEESGSCCPEFGDGDLWKTRDGEH